MYYSLKLAFIIIVLSGAAFLTGCDENPLRAQARENERQEVKQDREQETKYGSEISKASKNRN